MTAFYTTSQSACLSIVWCSRIDGFMTEFKAEMMRLDGRTPSDMECAAAHLVCLTQVAQEVFRGENVMFSHEGENTVCYIVDAEGALAPASIMLVSIAKAVMQSSCIPTLRSLVLLSSDSGSWNNQWVVVNG